MNNQELRNLIRESLNSLMENIDVPIKVGDTVLGGKFKNKKIKVKDIDKNEKGDITINDKPLLRVRIPKDVSEGLENTEVYNVYYTRIDPTGGGVDERILLNKNPFIHQRAANQFAEYQAKKHKVQFDKTHTAAWGSNNVIQIFTEKKKTLAENNVNKNIFFHGTRTKLPFKNFVSDMDGSGLVSSGGRYGGFFFTDSFENAEFYTEYFICKVQIDNIQPNPTRSTNSPEVLKQANMDNQTYIIEDVLDGAVFSNIVVVPHSKINDINIVGWEFIGDKDFYFEELDKLFGMEDDNFLTQNMIQEFCDMTDTDLNFLLSINVFKEYYDSKK
jgi:hypothetical protein